MKQKIMIVDDEPELLKSLSSILNTRYNVSFADSPLNALEKIKTSEPFSCIISDFRMPIMNGVEFFTEVMKINKDTVRVLMTGYADFQTVVNAVNNGNIYRFLSKPVSIDLLIKNIDDSIRQYELIQSERELIDKTLKGTIKLLLDIQSVTNPKSNLRLSRLRNITKKIAETMNIEPLWELEIALMLSNIGQIGIPQDIVDKLNNNQLLSDNEWNIYNNSYKIGSDLIKNIPRLKNVAQIIEYQALAYNNTYVPETILNSYQFIYSQIIVISKEYDYYISQGLSHEFTIEKLKQKNFWNKKIIGILEKEVSIKKAESQIKNLRIKDLKPDMILESDIIDSYGLILYGKGKELTELIILKLLTMSKTRNIIEPITVRLNFESTDDGSTKE